MVHLIKSQRRVESPILGNLNIAPQLQEEDAVGQSDDGGPEDPDVVGLGVDDEVAQLCVRSKAVERQLEESRRENKGLSEKISTYYVF